MKRIRGFIISLVVLSLCGMCVHRGSRVPDQNSLIGAWMITETTVKTPNGNRTDTNPQPGVYLFTARHFSNMLIPNEKRPILYENSTDSERLAAFTNFVADCGTYEVEGSKIITRNIVAKLPNAMQAAGEGATNIIYEFGFDGEELILILVSAWAAPGGKIEYRLKRLE